MTITDDEFGEVVVRRSALASAIKFSFAPDGRLRISAPRFLSDRRVMGALDASREAVRALRPKSRTSTVDLENLRKKAKWYLPRRLLVLAKQHGFSYSMGKLTHSSTRWGSCNSQKRISLNIGLMKLPKELIDYVIIHELCHTKHMNHSTAFWDEVSKYDVNYKKHRKVLKMFSPAI